jgi:phenylacetate-CoA ligase
MGRADQTTKVRGMFVHPAQVADILKRAPQALRARLVVSGRTGADVMTLRVEAASPPPDLADTLVQALRDVTKLRGEVEFVAPGSLPSDGKVIEDIRSLD